jgi:reverse gyrase
VSLKYLCPECQGYIEWKWANRGYRTCEQCVNANALDKAREVLRLRPELAEMAKQLLRG